MSSTLRSMFIPSIVIAVTLFRCKSTPQYLRISERVSYSHYRLGVLTAFTQRASRPARTFTFTPLESSCTVPTEDTIVSSYLRSMTKERLSWWATNQHEEPFLATSPSIQEVFITFFRSPNNYTLILMYTRALALSCKSKQWHHRVVPDRSGIIVSAQRKEFSDFVFHRRVVSCSINQRSTQRLQFVWSSPLLKMSRLPLLLRNTTAINRDCFRYC